MHELFLTAAVKDGDFEMASAILQGLTWMTARHNVYRVSFYAGQPQPRGFSNLKSILPPPQSNRGSGPLWNELSKQLSRSSYVVQLEHEVSPDADFGNGATVDLNSVPGTLRWTDFPDPLRDTPITQRKRIDIPDQKGLIAAMADNQHTYKTEFIHETYSFIRGNEEFTLSRYYYLPGPLGQTPPAATLPPFQDLKVVDPARKWTLNVKMNVMDDNQPEKMKKAHEALMKVKIELDQIFDFKIIDRRIFDTRIAPPPVIPGRG